MIQAPLQHFLKHSCIVGAEDAPDLEFPILVFIWGSINKNYHRSNGRSSRNIRNIIALDAKFFYRFTRNRDLFRFVYKSDVLDVFQGEDLLADLHSLLEIKFLALCRHFFFKIPQDLFLLAFEKQFYILNIFQVIRAIYEPCASSGTESDLVIKTRPFVSADFFRRMGAEWTDAPHYPQSFADAGGRCKRSKTLAFHLAFPSYQQNARKFFFCDLNVEKTFIVLVF